MATKKKDIDSTRLGLVDKETGEILDGDKLILVARKIRIKGFFMGMQDGFEFLAKSKLNGEALKVLLMLMGRMDYENIIRISQKEICEVLGMQKQNVGRAMKALRESGFLANADFRAVKLNSDIGWKGTVQSLREHQRDETTKMFGRTKRTTEEEAEIDAAIAALPSMFDTLNRVPPMVTPT